jgi:hypothetical protein
MDDGREILAKLPNPNAGPAHFTVASEVATREFVSERLCLRRILLIDANSCVKCLASRSPESMGYGWSSDRNNPVGAEYILEEKASGKPLGSLWHQIPRKSKLNIVSQVVELEDRLASLTFDRQGCLYFRDASTNGLTADDPLITNPPIPSAMCNRFTLGPVTTPELWDSEDAGLEADRGPCK